MFTCLGEFICFNLFFEEESDGLKFAGALIYSPGVAFPIVHQEGVKAFAHQDSMQGFGESEAFSDQLRHLIGEDENLAQRFRSSAFHLFDISVRVRHHKGLNAGGKLNRGAKTDYILSGFVFVFLFEFFHFLGEIEWVLVIRRTLESRIFARLMQLLNNAGSVFALRIHFHFSKNLSPETLIGFFGWLRKPKSVRLDSKLKSLLQSAWPGIDGPLNPPATPDFRDDGSRDLYFEGLIKMVSKRSWITIPDIRKNVFYMLPRDDWQPVMRNEKYKIHLIDGGVGQELYRRHQGVAHPLWSIRVMEERPELVEAVHRDFIAAGAEILTLNTYAATPARLARDRDAGSLERLHAQAYALADAARVAGGSAEASVRIAGCLPPLVGSYHPEATPDDATCRRHYKRIVQAQSQVDLFICETMSSLREGVLAAEAGLNSGRPVLLSFTVSDQPGEPALRSGEPVEDVVDAVKNLPIAGLLLNCSTPEAIDRALPFLAASGHPFGAYANGFTSVDALQPGGTVDALSPRQDLGPRAFAKWAMGWAEAGASYIGGCCEVSPAHIAMLNKYLRAGALPPRSRLIVNPV